MTIATLPLSDHHDTNISQKEYSLLKCNPNEVKKHLNALKNYKVPLISMKKEGVVKFFYYLCTGKCSFMKEIIIDSLEGLKEVADEVITSLDGRNIVAFCGPMGAGKTTLISAIMEHLGSEDSVTSPTFALVNQYATSEGEAVYHFDFYRINRIEEVFDMGYEEYFYSGDLCLIEWPELIEDLLPEEAMKVKIEILSPTERRFTIDATM